MIQHIVELLRLVNGETENIKIAQGKNKLPITFKCAVKSLKQKIQWLKK